jgi:hypothetical protein
MWNLRYYVPGKGAVTEHSERERATKRRPAQKRKKRKGPVRSYSGRAEVLRAMGFSSYRDYLASALWKRIRARVLRLHPFCYMCGKAAQQVHHKSYDEKTMRGRSLRQLLSVCRSCHVAIELEDGAKVPMAETKDRINRERALHRCSIASFVTGRW